MIVTLLENGKGFALEHDSWVIPWNLHIWDPFRSLHMEPSLLLVLTDSSNEGLAPDAPSTSGCRGDGAARQRLQQGLSEAVLASRPEAGASQFFYTFEVRTQE